MVLGNLIGKGERSKVYEHPTDPSKAIKVTSYSAEKKVIKHFYKNPSSFFVTVHSVEVVGKLLYAVVDRVTDADFRFSGLDGRPWWASRFERKHTILSDEEMREYFKSNVIESHLVDEYFDLLLTGNRLGCDYYDSAWNIGFLNGKMVCFDTTM